MNVTATGTPKSWAGIAKKLGIDDPYASLRDLWTGLSGAEKRILLQAAELPASTSISQIINDGEAKLIAAAIRRASSWASKLGEKI